MPELRLDALRETLLRAGVAPRHVRRYMRELKQHFDDVVRDEMLAGRSAKEAHQVARARLGSDEELAAAMLAQPELRSITARYPWAVFGVSPPLIMGVTLVGAVFFEIGLLHIHEWLTGADTGHAPAWFKWLIVGWNNAMMYAVPLLVALSFCVVGARQRLALGWIALGSILSGVLGAAVLVKTIFNYGVGMSELSVDLGFDSSMWPRFWLNMVLAGLMVAACWAWKRRERALG